MARLTRHVPLAEQTLTTVPEHMSSPTIVSGVRESDLEIYVFCRSLFGIVLSVLLRYMDSDLPFGIFKLFYIRKKYRIIWTPLVMDINKRYMFK